MFWIRDVVINVDDLSNDFLIQKLLYLAVMGNVVGDGCQSGGIV
jgi:hypothetical protein